MKNNIVFVLFTLVIFVFSTNSVFAQKKEVNIKKESGLQLYEFEELKIKVKIQEPEVFFILDEPDVSVSPFYGDMDFLEKIEDPLIKEDLF